MIFLPLILPSQVIAVKLIFDTPANKKSGLAHLANCRGVGEEVDGVLLPHWAHPVVPASLDVRDLLAVADGLNVVGGEGRGRAEQGSHALGQGVANCKKIF